MARITTGSGQPPERALQRFREQVLRENQRTLEALAIELKTEIVRNLSTPGQGRYYARYARVAGETPRGPRNAAERASLARRHLRTRRLNAQRSAAARGLNDGSLTLDRITSARTLTGLHRASKPGDPPAPDTGTMRRSAYVERTATGMRVGVAAPYAAALEFGTVSAGKSRRVVILPRPFMRPALAALTARTGVRFTARRGGL